jgi:hypothetical protein
MPLDERDTGHSAPRGKPVHTSRSRVSSSSATQVQNTADLKVRTNAHATDIRFTLNLSDAAKQRSNFLRNRGLTKLSTD